MVRQYHWEHMNTHSYFVYSRIWEYRYILLWIEYLYFAVIVLSVVATLATSTSTTGSTDVLVLTKFLGLRRDSRCTPIDLRRHRYK